MAISPRISFSHDVLEENPTQNDQEETETIRLDNSLLLDTASDFNFCVTSRSETCLADELFFNGVIIPTKMREKLSSTIDNQEVTSTTTTTLIREEKSHSKSFWRFGRSSSLNCDSNSNYNQIKKSSIWSSLPLLSRSKSTGSATNKVGSSHCKSMKLPSSNGLLLPPHHKGSLRKGSFNGNHNGGSYNNNNYCGRNSAIFNVPPPYIARGTSDLLGLGSLFRNGSSKEKKNRK